MTDQALLQPNENHEEELMLQDKRRQAMQNLSVNNLKSFEVLKSAVKNITSNTKLLFLMILSVLPCFAFMVYNELNIPEVKDAISVSLIPHSFSYTYDYNGKQVLDYEDDLNDPVRKKCRILLEFFPFHLLLLPLLEIFSVSLICKAASKLNAGDTESSNGLKLQEITKEAFHPTNLKGLCITILWVHLLHILTLAGLIWIVTDHYMFSIRFDFDYSIDVWLNILSIAFHSLIFIVLVYKYLDWSAYWNLGTVISVMEEQSGIVALGLASKYRKHSKKIGFQLMLIFFLFEYACRLPCLYIGQWYESETNVLITCIAMMFVTLGILVKWNAFLLYFCYCKKQTMEKKVDDQDQGKVVINDV